MLSPLGTYLAAQKISRADFARELEVMDSTVSRWATGQRTPTISWALAIEKATGGAVPPSSWPEPSRRRVRHRPRRRRSPQQSPDHS